MEFQPNKNKRDYTNGNKIRGWGDDVTHSIKITLKKIAHPRITVILKFP